MSRAGDDAERSDEEERRMLRCPPDREPALYAKMMGLIAECGGNVSSEHGVAAASVPTWECPGRPTTSRQPQACLPGNVPAGQRRRAMRRVKAALDPTGYLNAAVLFD